MTDFLMGAVSIFGGVIGGAIGFAMILFVFAVLAFPYVSSLTRRSTSEEYEGFLERSTDDELLGDDSLHHAHAHGHGEY